MGTGVSFLLGLLVFGMDLGAIFLIAKNVVRKEAKKNYLILFLLKILILFLVLGVVFKLFKPDIIIFTVGAFCSLIIVSGLIFLLNKNN